MGGHLGQGGVQLPPEILDELPHRTLYICHQRVTRVLHPDKNYSAFGGKTIPVIHAISAAALGSDESLVPAKEAESCGNFIVQLLFAHNFLEG
jgi:hypothetical protein